MPAKFTNHIREFVANSFIASIDSGKLTEWTTNTSYTIGQKVSANGNIYVCNKTGQSGAIMPSHISDQADDGSTGWIYVESLRTDKLFEGNLYLGIGRQSEWTDPLNPSDVHAIDSEEADVVNSLITLKKIGPNDTKACVAKNLWTSGTVYSQYDDGKEFDEYVSPFYVITDDLRIYKCLDNNSGAQSTSKPSAVQTSPFRLSMDGYVWKFMGVVDSADASIFMTDDFAPVNIVKSANENAEQWAVQNDAKDHTNSVSGWVIQRAVGAFDATPSVTVQGVGSNGAAAAFVNANVLRQVYVSNPGKDYVKASTFAIVKNGSPAGSGAVASLTINPTSGAITGVNLTNNGTGYSSGAVAVAVGTAKTGQTITPAVFTVNVDSGTGAVESINITSAGANYASAQLFIIPGTAGAVATPIMAPVNGHGSNIIKELGASTVMVSMKLTNSASDAGYMLVDAGSDFHQVCIVTDVIDKLTNTYASGNMLLGPLHPDYASTNNENISLVSYKAKAKVGTGTVLYINNIKKVVRNTDQEEDIKVAITL